MLSHLLRSPISRVLCSRHARQLSATISAADAPPPKKLVSSWNEWDVLEEVIVGVATGSAVPPAHPAERTKVDERAELRAAHLETAKLARSERRLLQDREDHVGWHG